MTLPQASTNFPNGWYADIENTGAGAWTITPATSTIDGAATLGLSTKQGVRIFSNGTNYYTQRGIGGGAGGNLNVSVNGSSIASQPELNFSSETSVTQTCVNNAGNNRVDCTPSLNTAVALTNANAKAGKPWFCSSTNGTALYTCSLNASVALSSYTPGMWLMLVADTASTGSQPSVNVDGVGVKSITQSDGTTIPTAGQIAARRPYWLYYDGTVFRMPAYSGVGMCNGITYLRGDGTCATTNAQSVGTALASASTIAPTSPMHHVTGTTQITTMTAPANFAAGGMGGCVVLIPDGAWTTGTTGNIALASTATLNRGLTHVLRQWNQQMVPELLIRLRPDQASKFVRERADAPL